MLPMYLNNFSLEKHNFEKKFFLFSKKIISFAFGVIFIYFLVVKMVKYFGGFCMKRLFFVLLLVGILLIGGCVQTKSDQKVVELSNSTVEGKLASTLNDSLKQTANCTASDYQGIANLANPLIQSAGIGISLPTDDAKAKEIKLIAIKVDNNNKIKKTE